MPRAIKHLCKSQWVSLPIFILLKVLEEMVAVKFPEKYNFTKVTNRAPPKSSLELSLLQQKRLAQVLNKVLKQVSPSDDTDPKETTLKPAAVP